MAYNKYTWVDGEVITAQKLNHIEEGIAESGGGDAGYECEETTEQFEETVTTSGSSPSPMAILAYTEPITADTLTITLDGVEYNCPKQEMNGMCLYGASSPADYSIYPFAFVSAQQNMLYTQTEGEHTIKVIVESSEVITTPCFEKAVEKVATPLIPTNEIVVVDASGTNMSATDYENALEAWHKGNPVLATLGASTSPAFMVGASSSLGGTTLYFEETHISQSTLHAVEVTVNTPNTNYRISKTIESYSLTEVASN